MLGKTDLPSCRPTQIMFPVLAALRAFSVSSSVLGHGSFTYSRQRTGALSGRVLTKRALARFREKISTCPWLELPPPPATWSPWQEKNSLAYHKTKKEKKTTVKAIMPCIRNVPITVCLKSTDLNSQGFIYKFLQQGDKLNPAAELTLWWLYRHKTETALNNAFKHTDPHRRRWILNKKMFSEQWKLELTQR